MPPDTAMPSAASCGRRVPRIAAPAPRSPAGGIPWIWPCRCRFSLTGGLDGARRFLGDDADRRRKWSGSAATKIPTTGGAAGGAWPPTVDFPAPFGPSRPTRKRDLDVKRTWDGAWPEHFAEPERLAGAPAAAPGARKRGAASAPPTSSTTCSRPLLGVNHSDARYAGHPRRAPPMTRAGGRGAPPARRRDHRGDRPGRAAGYARRFRDPADRGILVEPTEKALTPRWS